VEPLPEADDAEPLGDRRRGLDSPPVHVDAQLRVGGER
jgi:hypothetical protein